MYRIGKTPSTMKPNSQGLMNSRPQRRFRRSILRQPEAAEPDRFDGGGSNGHVMPRCAVEVEGSRGPEEADPRDVVLEA